MTSTPARPVDNVVIAMKGLQDRNTNIIAGTTVENKGKLILTTNSLPLWHKVASIAEPKRSVGFLAVLVLESGWLMVLTLIQGSISS